MRLTFIFFVVVLTFLFSSFLLQPTFNTAETAGCADAGCHDLNEGSITAVASGNLQVEVTVNNPGDRFAGELVAEDGTVVDYINTTGSNPFTLTAAQEGIYRINAGVDDNFDYDSAMVTLITSDIQGSQPEATIKNFELYPNHPNPFNNETLIRFLVPVAKQLSLNIYNLNGQRVRRLSEGQFSPGVYSFKWDGRNNFNELVTSGVYIYELKGEGYRSAKKLTLSK